MRELVQLIPDPDVLLKLAPEELGGTVLFILRKRWNPPAVFRFHPSNFINELWNLPNYSGPLATYPSMKSEQIDLAIAEAWGWLQAQGLLVPSMDSIGGGYYLTRRALAFENRTEYDRFAKARVLPRETLHRKIKDPVWMAFMRGEYDIAVLQAMKAVEVAVREAAKLPDSLVGVQLMRRAFDPKSGGSN